MDREGNPSKPLFSRVSATIIGTVGFAIFVGTLGFDFVYDDVHQILENPWIWHSRYLISLMIRAVWSFTNKGPSNYYRPVQTLLYFLDAQIFGRHPFGFHLTNALAHAFASVAAFLLLRRVTDMKRAALTAMLFALHPAHVESVAWISGSTDVDCALLTFLCLLTWSRARDALGLRGAALATGSGLLFLLALLAKETAVITPLLALSMPIHADWAQARSRPSGHAWRGMVLGMTPFAAALFIYVPLRLHALGGLHPDIKHAEFTSAQIVANGLALVPRYLLLTFFPWKLMPDHVFIPVSGLRDPLALTGALLLVVALMAAAASRRKGSRVTFAIGLLVLPLLPVLQVQYVGSNAQADRYLYIPALGACLLLVEGLVWLWERSATRVARSILVAVCILICVTAAGRTVTAATMWRDNTTLARAGIALEPRSVIMRLILSRVLSEAGRLDEASEVVRQAMELDPTDSSIATSAAELRIRREAKTPEEQIEMYNRLLAAGTGQPYLWTNLSVACLRAGRYQEAMHAAENALASDPYNTGAILNLGTAKGRLGDFAGQEREALRLLEIDSDSAPGWLNLGAARLSLGSLDRADADLSHAVDLDPKLARAHLYLSWIASRRARPGDALQQAKLASELDPTDPDIWNRLGVVLVQSGDREGARNAWERALTIAPNNKAAMQNLERLNGAAGQGKPRSATQGEE